MSGSAEEMIAYLEQGGQSLEQSVPKMSAAADDLGMAAGSYDMVQTVVDEARGFTRGVVSEAREAASALEPLAEVITELGGRLSAAGDSLMAAADAAKAAREHYGGAPGLTDDAAGKIEEAHGKAKESADGAYSAAGSFVQGVGEEHTPTPAAHQHSIMASDMADRTLGSIASEAGVAHANTLHPYGQQEELERASRVAANKMYELSAVVLRMIGDVALGAAVAHSLSDDGEQNGRALDDMAYEASGIAQEIRTAIELIRGDIVPSGMETQRETAEEVTRLRGLLGF